MFWTESANALDELSFVGSKGNKNKKSRGSHVIEGKRFNHLLIPFGMSLFWDEFEVFGCDLSPVYASLHARRLQYFGTSVLYYKS